MCRVGVNYPGPWPHNKCEIIMSSFVFILNQTVKSCQRIFCVQIKCQTFHQVNTGKWEEHNFQWKSIARTHYLI